MTATVPGFLLSPSRMLFTVACGTSEILLNLLGVMPCSRQSPRMRRATASQVSMLIPPHVCVCRHCSTPKKYFQVILHLPRELWLYSDYSLYNAIKDSFTQLSQHKFWNNPLIYLLWLAIQLVTLLFMVSVSSVPKPLIVFMKRLISDRSASESSMSCTSSQSAKNRPP